MATTLTPNMSLIVPTTGSEPGPTYANDINSSLILLDQHDHSPGKGIQITPAGLNINTNLNLQTNYLTNVGALVLTNQPSGNSTLQALYAAPGGETSTATNDLWYTDSNGTPIQITQNGIVKSTASSIPGESYAGGTFTWVQTQSGLPLTPANFAIGSILLQPTSPSTTQGVLLGPPTIPASTIQDIQLPTVPLSTSFMTMDTSGNMLTTIPTSGGITGSNIASATITGSNIAAGTITGSNVGTNTITGSNIALGTVDYNNLAPLNIAANAGTSGAFSTSSTVFVNVTNLSLNITTNGRPIMLMVQPDNSGTSFIFPQSTNGVAQMSIRFLRDGAVPLGQQIIISSITVPGISANEISGGFPFYLDAGPGAGTHTYTVQVIAQGASIAHVTGCILIAYEL